MLLSAAVLCCRIRKTVLEGCNVSLIGQNVDLTYPYTYLGEGGADLAKALQDKEFMKGLKEAKFPVVLVGPGILQRADRDQILQQVQTAATRGQPESLVTEQAQGPFSLL